MKRIENRIANLIAATCSAQEAAAYLDFDVQEHHRDQLVKIGVEILSNCRAMPGARASMSAMWVGIVRDRLSLPVHLVAGDLVAGGEVVFTSATDEGEIAAQL